MEELGWHTTLGRTHYSENLHMANISLSLPESSALLAPKTFVSKASNADLQARCNFSIEKKVREGLVDMGLITA